MSAGARDGFSRTKMTSRSHVQNPRQAQHWRNTPDNLLGKPVEPLLFVDPPHRQTHGIFADRAANAHQPRVDSVATNPVDMRVAPVPAEHAQKYRAQCRSKTHRLF